MNGVGQFTGSVCRPTDGNEITISFKAYDGGEEFVSDASKPFVVTSMPFFSSVCVCFFISLPKHA